MKKWPCSKHYSWMRIILLEHYQHWSVIWSIWKSWHWIGIRLWVVSLMRLESWQNCPCECTYTRYFLSLFDMWKYNNDSLFSHCPLSVNSLWLFENEGITGPLPSSVICQLTNLSEYRSFAKCLILFFDKAELPK